MPLYLLGINHRTAPITVREQVIFQPAQLPHALTALVALPGVQESLIVSTCNRTEIYYAAEDGADGAVRRWLLDFHDLASQVADCLYGLQDEGAVKHVFHVACGLDSAILGEPQILGQLKDAYRSAGTAGTVGPLLNRLFQQAFSVAKQVRSSTDIGTSSVSVASAAVALARQVFAGFERHTALLVGAGETIELVARHLHRHGLRRMIIANRSVARARDIATEFAGFAISLDEIDAHLREADILISSTASPEPLVRAEGVRAALRARRHRSMFIVDLAVPRDVEPATANLDNVYLYTVDDLQQVIEGNLDARRAAALEAGEIIAEHTQRFSRSLRALGAVPVIRTLRGQGEALRDEVLAEGMRLLSAGQPAAEVLEYMARALTNKLLHAPSERLRRAGEHGEIELLELARELYRIDEGGNSEK